jgi:hypothetical protein
VPSFDTSRFKLYPNGGISSDVFEKIRQLACHVHNSNNANNKKYPMTENMQEQSRRFSLDLTPRLLYARGEMVELLISSNIARQIPPSPQQELNIFCSFIVAVFLIRILHFETSHVFPQNSFQNFTEYNSVVDPETHGSLYVDFGRLDPDPGGQILLIKRKKVKMYCFEKSAGCSPMRAGGFSGSLYK